MNTHTVGQSAMVGWRSKLGERIAEPVARRSPLEAQQVYTGLGLIFLGLSIWYVGSTIARVVRGGASG